MKINKFYNPFTSCGLCVKLSFLKEIGFVGIRLMPRYFQAFLSNIFIVSSLFYMRRLFKLNTFIEFSLITQ